MVQYACDMPDFKAVKWSGTTCLCHARLRGSESECGGVVKHAGHMSDLKAVSVVWYIESCKTCACCISD